MLVSPSESPASRALGTSSWRCEDHGVDFWWIARKQSYGVQRKALKDLIASVEDGRLAKERIQWRSLDHAYLVVETGERGGGAPREMPSTALAGVGKFGRAWTGPQYRGLLLSLAADGVTVLYTRDEPETIERVMELEKWSRKDRHASARGRGQTPTDVFGKRGQREYAVWILTSLPGVGTEMAGRLFDHFGGLPIRMAEGVGMKELMAVPGVGKVVAKRILDVFSDGEVEV